MPQAAGPGPRRGLRVACGDPCADVPGAPGLVGVRRPFAPEPFGDPARAGSFGGRGLVHADLAGLFVRGEQRAVQRAAGLELRRRADVDNPAAVEHGDPVGEFQRRGAVGDDQRRPLPGHLVQPGVDVRLDLGVDRGGGVVEDQHVGVAQDGAGERDALALTAGECQALFANHRGVAVRQRGDEPIRLRHPRGPSDLLDRRVGAAVRDVGRDRVGEQVRLLEDEADRGPQVCGPYPAHVDAADPDRPGARVVEARQQGGCRGLA